MFSYSVCHLQGRFSLGCVDASASIADFKTDSGYKFGSSFNYSFSRVVTSAASVGNVSVVVRAAAVVAHVVTVVARATVVAEATSARALMRNVHPTENLLF